jgi:putative ABC transport system substrate-binding protein
MNQRTFIAGLGSAAALPVPAWAQQSPIPLVGFIRSGTPEAGAGMLAAFLKGLSETGFVEGRNLAIEALTRTISIVFSTSRDPG